MLITSRSFLFRMRNVSDRIVEKIKTHILCSVTFFFLENRAVYETMWKNTVDRGRPQMTPWRMHIARWISKATNTHSGCVILLFHCNNCMNAPQCYGIHTVCYQSCSCQMLVRLELSRQNYFINQL